MILLAAIGLATLLAPACGGRLENLSNRNVPSLPVVAFLFVIQFLSRSLELTRRASVSLWCLSVLVLVSILWFRMDRGKLLAVGVLLNLVVVAMNVGMPVASGTRGTTAAFYQGAGESTYLLMLSDILPVPGGWLVSLGDLVLGVAVIGLVIAWASGPRTAAES